MLNNVSVKRFMKYTVFKPLSLINKIIPKNDKLILLYSGNMGIRHNLTPIKNKLLKGDYTKKYKVICGIESIEYAGEEKELKYVTHFKSVFYFLRARHVFYTAGQIPIKPSNKQIVIHTNHGTSDLKSMGVMTKINNGDEFYFTYMLVPSELYVPIYAKEYECPEKNVMVCGEPMTDTLFNKKCDYRLGTYNKIILWLPTFKQSAFLNYNDSNEGFLPLFKNNEYDELNMKLRSLDFLLIVKLHTAQDTQGIDIKKYSNIKIYTNSEFVSKGYDLYELLPQADALLGDYSSVSLQFLLLNKPLAFVVPDMEEYRKKRGFCFDEPEKYMPGPLIKTKDQLYSYFHDLLGENDAYKEEREKVKDKIFKYQDGDNCKRVLEISDIHK